MVEEEDLRSTEVGKECDLAIRQFDRYRKGCLDYDEFVGMLLPLKRSEETLERIEQIIDPYSSDECAAEMGEHRVPEEVEKGLVQVVLLEIKLGCELEKVRRQIVALICEE